MVERGLGTPTPPPDADVLARDGWTYRFLAVGERISEVAELYRSLGFEVRLEAVAAPAGEPGCAACVTGPVPTRAIYTRRPSPAAGEAP